MTILEKFSYTIRPTDAVMQPRTQRRKHDDSRPHPRATGGAEDHADARPEAAVARTLRQRAAAVQPALPRIPPGLPHPGTAYGGLKPETIRRLERLGEELDGGDKKKRGLRLDRDRPITGTRLLREWQGVEYAVTVTADGFEWPGRPYKSLSASAPPLTATPRNCSGLFRPPYHRRPTP